MYRGGLDRFKKAQSLEPFAVAANSAPKPSASSAPQAQIVPADQKSTLQQQNNSEPDVNAEGSKLQATQVGGGQSTWQPPDWAIEPRPGVYCLEVLKDGEVLDKINVDKRRLIFGRQAVTCDFVLDHPSVSRQHAAVVPHKNGSIYVIDMGSVHGTFVANERLRKDNPVELEVGQSLRFAASTRSYILQKNTAALFPSPALPEGVTLPSPPDPSDEDAVVAYNTILNRYGLSSSNVSGNSSGGSASGAHASADSHHMGRPSKRVKKARVAFKDQFGGELVDIVGISDGTDVETEPGPIGIKEGSLVGKYESLVQVTVIPKGKEQIGPKEGNISSNGVTDKLQQVLNRVRSTPKHGIHDDLYEEAFVGKAGSSWAYKSEAKEGIHNVIQEKPSLTSGGGHDSLDDSDDLFGESEDGL